MNMHRNVAVALSAMLVAGVFGSVGEAWGSTVVEPPTGAASAEPTRTYTWSIIKTANISEWTLAPGESKEIIFEISVEQTVVDSVPGAEPLVIIGYSQIHVTDSLVWDWTGNALGTTTWYVPYTVHGSINSPSSWWVVNTATITETGQSDDAEVLIKMMRTVPEPGTFALLGLGLAGLGLSRRRKAA